MIKNRTSWDDDFDYPVETTREVIEQEKTTFTGLYDKNGNPVHRERKPIGYIH